MTLSELLQHEPAANLVFLCGAGVSYPTPTNLPTVRTFIEEAVQFCTDDPIIRSAVRSKFETMDILPRFEVIIDELRKLKDPSLKLSGCFDAEQPNTIHHFLAERLAHGSAVITTNFDTCIERAANPKITRVIFDGNDLCGSPPRSHVIVKPHGSHSLDSSQSRSPLVITIDALAHTSHGFSRFPNWRKYLLDLLFDRVIVVVGYSGSDDFDLTPIMADGKPRHLTWIDYDASETGLVIAKLNRARSNVQRICANHDHLYLRGTVAPLLSALVAKHALQFGPATAGTTDTRSRSVSLVFSEICPTPRDKLEALNLILLCYDLNELVRSGASNQLSPETALQSIKASYRLSRFTHVLNEVDHFLKSPATDSQISQARYFKAAALYQTGNLDAAYKSARAQYFLSRALPDKSAHIRSINNIAGIAFGQSRFCRSEMHYKQALKLCALFPFIEGEATAIWGLADLAASQGRIGGALENYARALELHQSLGNRLWTGWLERNIAEVLIDAGNLAEAKGHLESATVKLTDVGSTAGLIWVKYSLAKLEFRSGNNPKAATEIKKAFDLIGDNSAFPVVPELILLAGLVDHKEPNLGVMGWVRNRYKDGFSQTHAMTPKGPGNDRITLAHRLLQPMPTESDDLLTAECILFSTTPV